MLQLKQFWFKIKLYKVWFAKSVSQLTSQRKNWRPKTFIVEATIEQPLGLLWYRFSHVLEMI